MKNGLFLTLVLSLAASCGGASDPKTLTNEGSAALSAGKYSEAVKSFEAALAGMDSANPDWMHAKVGLVEALVHSDPARAKSEFLALAGGTASKLTDRHFSEVASTFAQAGKIADASEILKAGMAMHPESPQLTKLLESLGDLAKASGDAQTLESLKGLGYAGD
ncbi:MAG: hypothetical protein ABL998_09160 [Planctomycetota bacterium]